MTQELFNQAYLSEQHVFLMVQIVVALLTLGFLLWQVFINRRLKELQDYVSVSFVPNTNAGSFEIRIYNVGGMNLYLHKFELGNIAYTFQNEEARLLPIGGRGDNFYAIPVVPSPVNTEQKIRLYLTDEFDKKYMSEGAYIIDAIPTIQQSVVPTEGVATTAQLPALQLRLRSWTYHTKKFKWKF